MNTDIIKSVKDNLVKKQEILESRLKLHNMERGFNDYANDVIYAVSKSPELSKCTPDSIVDSALQIAKAGLYIGGNITHLVPFGTTCSFQIGYQGYGLLLSRIVKIIGMYYDVVYEDDKFEAKQTESATEQGLKCIATFSRERGASNKIKGAFCYTKLADSNSFIDYLEINELDKYRKEWDRESKSFKIKKGGQFWSWEREMFSKQIIKIQHRRIHKFYDPQNNQNELDVASEDATNEMQIISTEQQNTSPKSIQVFVQDYEPKTESKKIEKQEEIKPSKQVHFSDDVKLGELVGNSIKKEVVSL
jgi:recombinational DNA repair protein RecT